MQTSSKEATRSWRARGLTGIALAVGLALCAPAHAQRTATATAQVVNGLVVGITVTDGGAGYPVGPQVTITGGGGSGARGTATVSGGVVVAIAVDSAGAGYTSVPEVVIAAPPPAEAPVLRSVRLMTALTIEGAVGSTNWIVYADELAPNNWRVLTNVVVAGSPYEFVDQNAPWTHRYYQVASGPEPPRPPVDTNLWAWIPAGTFTMGSPDTEQDRGANEGPQTTVTLTKGFYIGRHEVTQAEYQAVMGSNPSAFTGDLNRPVECVSWDDATNYCGRLTEQERAAGRLPAGYVYRLPTEAEWEYACRAGTTTRFSYGDDPNYSQLANYAWYFSNSGSQTHPVGQKLPNPWGLYDMSGNVWEWCLDWYGAYPGGAVTDPTGPNSGSYRVFRGGGWETDAWACRVPFRNYYWPGNRYSFHGFRAVLAPGATGCGYTSTPQVVIAAPPPPEAPVLRGVRLGSAITIEGSLGTTNWILYVDVVDQCPYTWRVLTNVVVTESPYTVMDWEAIPQKRFYRAASELPVFEPDTNRWVWIPPGTFTMGSPASEQDREVNEGPQTVVTLTRGFWLGRYEVTQAEYQAVMGSNPSAFTGDLNRPVECVSWHDATNYCAKLTAAERAAGRLPCDFVYRLPTEAQWEYACRAGTRTRFSYGDDPDYSQLANYAWYSSNSGWQTHPVGQKLPNPWGLYDMSGNVWEWCLDLYGVYSGGNVTDAGGPSGGSYRVYRGGCWGDVPKICRSALRFTFEPRYRFGALGFRAALVAVP